MRGSFRRKTRPLGGANPAVLLGETVNSSEFVLSGSELPPLEEAVQVFQNHFQ